MAYVSLDLPDAAWKRIADRAEAESRDPASVAREILSSAPTASAGCMVVPPAELAQIADRMRLGAVQTPKALLQKLDQCLSLKLGRKHAVPVTAAEMRELEARTAGMSLSEWVHMMIRRYTSGRGMA